jgi:tetratricopeptide (TPR) repeat protein
MLVSYGAAVGVLFLFAGIARWRDNFYQLYWAALGILLLVAAALLQVAFGDPLMLRRLADEADWQQAAQQFALQYLPSNRGFEYVVWRTLPLDTVARRLIAGWYFMGGGWYATLIAAAATWVIAFNSVRGLRSMRRVALTGGLVIFVFGAFSARPLVSQHKIVEATRAEARGDTKSARELYRSAVALDGWNALRIDIRERVGIIDEDLGQTGTSDYRIYLAEASLEQGRATSAVREYEQLESSGGAVAALARSRIAAIWTDFGLQLYATGAFGGAVLAWQKALAQVPSHWLAAFLLTRGYFAVGQYSRTAELAQRLVKSSDPIFVANLYGNMGDARTRAGSFGEGHVAYSSSYLNDYVNNRRGIASLVGP